MKIAAAQIKSYNADIPKNIEMHKKCIKLAAANRIDFIAFPELSLCSYEPNLSHTLAMDENDSMLDVFQLLSEENKICIALGLVTRKDSDNYISMAIFQPDKERSFYSKQILHEDENTFFKSGIDQSILNISDKLIAPAICYESMQSSHAEKAGMLGAELYMACVAKDQKSLYKAFMHYPNIAAQHKMSVIMCNNIGINDNFCSAGQSAIWSSKGQVLGKLDSKEEALLVLDTELNHAYKIGIEG